VPVEIAIITCQAIKQSHQMETLVIGLFPQLCLLTPVDHPSLRTEAEATMEAVNNAKAMDDATSRMEDAERRASASEQENELLTVAIEELREENSRLQRGTLLSFQLQCSSALS
jgi:hypothetical protein